MADEHSNTKSEDATMAFDKRRSRRVSFAENTSVHIFDRDEDSGTPPDPNKHPDSPSGNLGFAERDSNASQNGEESNDDDNYSNDEDDDDELGPRSPFLRLLGSPSPGGSTAGSTTSNDDEDNFFGPVSASFIRRRLSDSAASDENHEPTMDSTAFSMHFRSIARSDTEGDLKTTTGVQLSFEDKTPIQDSIPANTGSSMVLTVAKKQNFQPSVSTSELNAGSESNDMSLVGEYHHKYDYGKLSPTLDALLAEGSKDLHVISTSNISIPTSPRNARKQFSPNKETGPCLMDLSHSEANKLEGTISCEVLNGVVSLKHNELGVANAGSISSPSKQTLAASSHISDAQTSKTLSPNQPIKVPSNAKTKEPVKGAFEISPCLGFTAAGLGSPLNPKDVVHNLDEVARKVYKSPLIGSVTSLTDKRSHVLLHGASPSQSPWAVTPSHNQASGFVNGGSLLSIQKSISKLRMIEASPFSAALNTKYDSNSRTLVSLSKMIPLDTLSDKNRKAPQANCMSDNGTEILDTFLNEQLPSATQTRREKVGSTNMDDSRTETPSNIARLENFVKVASPLALPTQDMSGEMIQPYLLTSAEKTYGYKDKIGSPHNFGHSPLKKLKMANTAEFKGSPLGAGKQRTEHSKAVSLGPSHVTGSVEKNTNTSLSTAVFDRTDSLYTEIREQSTPLDMAVFNEEEMVDDREVVLHDLGCDSETRRSKTISKDKEHDKYHSKFTKSDISSGGVKTASLVLHGMENKQSCQKNLADQFCDTEKEVYNEPHRDNSDSFPEEDVWYPSGNKLSNRDVSSAERKRKTEDGMIEKILRTERSPKFRKGDVSDREVSSDSGISGVSQTLKYPAEIHTRFSKETKQLLSQSVDKINLHAIDHLMDILGQLQRSKTYQLFSAEILSQKYLDVGSNLLHKRAAETQWLLCKILHEKAKLQLVHVKRRRLQERAQALASGIQESEVLRLNCSPQQYLDAEVAHRRSVSKNIDRQECQIHRDEVTSKGQTLEDIDRKITSLTKSFHKTYKMKGEPNSSDTIAVVNNHLVKKACCQIIRKDFQLWVVDNLESRNGEHNVVLNYLDVMIQRITVNAGPVPRISISNKLNDINIVKNFKDLDASTAFGFVFNAEITLKHVGSTNLAQETQMSSCLLGNLLDVVEEVQLARIELRNLTSTRFHRPSAEHLHLELHFFEPKHRRKAILTLDLSCLKRGIYPSDIIPCQVEIPINGPQTSSEPSLLAEITVVVQILEWDIRGFCGYVSAFPS